MRPRIFAILQAERGFAQIEMGEIEIGVRALEHDDTNARACVHSRQQILEPFKHPDADDVERRMIE